MENVINITVIDEKKPSLLDDFKKHLEAKKTTAYNTNYSSGIYRSKNINESDDKTIFFYEFSDLTRHPLKFIKITHFIQWAKEHKIYISSYTEKQLRENDINYATCYKGSATLMIRSSYEYLKIAQRSIDYNNREYSNAAIGNLGSGLYNCRDEVWWD